MFGIDLGISVSSVICTTGRSSITTKMYSILDYSVLFGNKQEPDIWKRIVDMSDAIVISIMEICKSKPGVIIQPLVAIEEPVFPFRTRNPASYFNMCCLYALTRNKLMKRNFTIYSIHPLSVKSTARTLAFKNKKLNDKYTKCGSLTKKGMVRAFKIITGNMPDGTNNTTRETIADSFFIAQTGILRRKVGIK